MGLPVKKAAPGEECMPERMPPPRLSSAAPAQGVAGRCAPEARPRRAERRGR